MKVSDIIDDMLVATTVTMGKHPKGSVGIVQGLSKKTGKIQIKFGDGSQYQYEASQLIGLVKQ